LLLGIVLRQTENHVRRCLHGALDDSDGVPKRVLRGVALSDAIERITPSADHPVHRIDGFLARDLAGSVATHPVRHDVQPEVVIDEESIFVQLSALSDVGQSGTVVLQLILVQQWRPPTGPRALRLAKNAKVHQEEGGNRSP
jgi:hypothetical protein